MKDRRKKIRKETEIKDKGMREQRHYQTNEWMNERTTMSDIEKNNLGKKHVKLNSK